MDKEKKLVSHPLIFNKATGQLSVKKQVLQHTQAYKEQQIVQGTRQAVSGSYDYLKKNFGKQRGKVSVF